MIGADPDHFFEACLIGWGGAAIGDFPEIEAYRTAWRHSNVIAGMCHDYRAGVGIDLKHDREDSGCVLDMPALVLWGGDGVMARHFDVAAIWRERLSNMRAQVVSGGHFFVDQSPGEVVAALSEFFTDLAVEAGIE